MVIIKDYAEGVTRLLLENLLLCKINPASTIINACKIDSLRPKGKEKDQGRVVEASPLAPQSRFAALIGHCGTVKYLPAPRH